MNKKEQAMERRKKGYNCAQSVACPFAVECGVEEKALFKATEALGFGMGYMGVCGAVSAMAIVVGLKNSDGNLQDPKTKKSSYSMNKNMKKKFLEKNQSIICSELKGVETGKPLRSCEGCIEDAIDILEEFLTLKG